mgnify:CR=1 FL=1
MCGIVGYVGKRDCTEVLLNGLGKLEYRGYDSAGIAVFQDGKITVAKSKGRLKDLEEKMEREGRPFGHVGIGHTRWATHGEPSVVNAHPHYSRDQKIAVVHNGIIENYQEIKERLINKGFSFVSQTDTEVVAQLLDYYYMTASSRTIRNSRTSLREKA